MQRAESTEKYGTWFSKGVTAEEVSLKCLFQIERCKTWITNLTTLKEEADQEVDAKKKEEIKKVLRSMTKEEVLALYEEQG